MTNSDYDSLFPSIKKKKKDVLNHLENQVHISHVK